MKIIIKADANSPKIIIDFGAIENHFPYRIRDFLWEALRLDDYTEEAIREVFNQEQDAKKEPGA